MLEKMMLAEMVTKVGAAYIGALVLLALAAWLIG